jgi:hypothetical protein
MQADACANCGVQIGKLETPYIWGDSIVCGACIIRLNAAANIAAASPEFNPEPVPVESLRTDDDLGDLAAAASRARTGRGKTINYSSRRPGPKQNFLKRWQWKSGKRSFILQCVLAGWTTLCFCIGVAFLFQAAPEARIYSNEYVGAQLMGSWMCLFGGWAFIAIPVGIAAVVTLKPDDER